MSLPGTTQATTYVYFVHQEKNFKTVNTHLA